MMRYTILLIGFLALCSCGSMDLDEEITDSTASATTVRRVDVHIAPAYFDADTTRALHEVDPVRGFVTQWTVGDTIGVYPIGGDQVAFPISEGEGSASACFDGGSWALRPSYQYAAYYPFSHRNYLVSASELPVNYEGQEQHGNLSTAHLAAYDYLASSPSSADVMGNLTFGMRHLGAFVVMTFTLPRADSFLSLEIESNDREFVTTGFVDLSAEQPQISTRMTSPVFRLSLNEVQTDDNCKLTLYAMMAPNQMGSSKFTFRLTDLDGDTYVYSAKGKNFTAGKSYRYMLDELEEEPVCHDAVDLGLTVKWATFNLGAEAPHQAGTPLAWGEWQGKTDYRWNNYALADGTVKRLGKYCEDEIFGTIDQLRTLQPTDDAARRLWGEGWRVPTAAEFSELISCCSWTWTRQEGVAGYKITSRVNSGSIFLPVTGYQSGESVYDASSFGYYWTASLTPYYSCHVRSVSFCSEFIDFYNNSRCNGQMIRPVFDPED